MVHKNLKMFYIKYILFYHLLFLFIINIFGLPLELQYNTNEIELNLNKSYNSMTKSQKVMEAIERFKLNARKTKEEFIDPNDHFTLLQSYMDETADPCDDFYQYACGNWEKHHEIPSNFPSYDIFAILNVELQKSLQELLTETININSNNKKTNDKVDIEEQVSIFYSSCIDIESINKRGSEPILKLLKTFGGFPLLEGKEWSPESYYLEDVLALQSIYQTQSFFYTGIVYDLEDSAKTVIYLQHPELGLRSHADYLESYNKPHLDGYRDFISEVFELLNAPKEQIPTVVDEIIEFEKNIANLTDTRTRKYEVHHLYDGKTIGILKEQYPKFNWTEYIKKIYAVDLSDDFKIVIFGAPNTDKIFELLINTDKRILANYISWHTIQQVLDYLDDGFKEPKNKFTKILTGSEASIKKRDQLCAKEVNSGIGMAVGALYVKKFFDEKSKEEVLKITQSISNVFRNNLHTYDWIDDETKKLAEAKVNKTVLAVGYPDFILNKTALNKRYEDVNFEHGKYFENMLNLRRFENMKEKQRLGKDVDKLEWPIRPAIINAFFEQPKNRVIMPAAILQPPVYRANFPKSLNYGAIGVFIGHELTHGFDTTGRGFDEDGNMKNWWTEKSYKQFKDRTQCFIDQYDKFQMYNKSLNGDITKEENIADNGGIRLSYKVFSDWLNSASEEEIKAEAIPGLNLSPKQLFFVAFAQSWCEYIRPEAIENRLETDTHSPGKFRIIGTLQNFEEFSNAYQCPVKSTMNPNKKCRLW